MDMLEQAREKYDAAHEGGYERDAQLAQASAMISIAEQLKRIADALELQGTPVSPYLGPHGRLFKTEMDDRSTAPDWGAA